MCGLKEKFQQLKNEYTNNMNERENIIVKMQENLKQRTTNEIVKCLDENEYRTDSDNVEELYAIDGALSQQASADKMTRIGEEQRQHLKNNKYTPDNPYYNNEE